MNDIVKSNQGQALTGMAAFRRDLDIMQGEIESVLPRHVTFDRFRRVVLTAVQQGYGIAKCTPKSIFAACLQCAKDGLMPDGREAALVAFKDTCQYMPMVSGLIKLARQSGDISTIIAQIVYEKDEFEIDLFSDQRPSLKPFLDGDRGKFRVACAVVTFKDGTHLTDVMTFGQIEKVRKISRSGEKGPWKDHWDEMARKTVLRRLIKYLSLSPELARALDADNATYEAKDNEIARDLGFTSAGSFDLITQEQPALDNVDDDGVIIDPEKAEAKLQEQDEQTAETKTERDRGNNEREDVEHEEPLVEPKFEAEDSAPLSPAERINGTTNWDGLQVVLATALKEVPEAYRDALRAIAYTKWQSLKDQGQKPPEPSYNATVFNMMLAAKPDHAEAQKVWNSFIRTEAYKALSGEQKQGLAGRLEALKGGA